MITDAERIVAQAELCYVSDRMPGIRRRRSGQGFSYRDAAGRLIRDRAERRRIESLAVPPAWREVWICPLPQGHIQATGIDERGRKQYRYHTRWQEASNRVKFQGLAAFGRALPRIRRRVARDLEDPQLTRGKVLALVIRLLDATSIRVGNEEYQRRNASFGLTTLRDEHLTVSGERIRLRFPGKGQKLREVSLRDRRLARTLRDVQDLPGQELFQYMEADGQPVAVDSADVNVYLRSAAGADSTAKDFRTWRASTVAAKHLQAHGDQVSLRERRRVLKAAIAEAAAELGNTVTICRKYYVHPMLTEAYLEGRLEALVPKPLPRATQWLSADERLLLAMLETAGSGSDADTAGDTADRRASAERAGASR